ncbi:D-glycero-beta-D-manno-heptose 1-phosphate adenylyltransferase [Aquifex pyrophilus]
MLVSLKELLRILEEERKKGKKVVFTNGCFDIIHAGHVDYLEKAKKLGDILVVGLNSDDSIRRIKGEKRPVNTQEHRAKVLSSLKPVDYVVIFEEDTPEKLIKAIKPDVLVKGGDWPLEKIVGKDFVESYGGKVLTIPFTYDVSTTKIIEKILKLYCK